MQTFWPLHTFFGCWKTPENKKFPQGDAKVEPDMNVEELHSTIIKTGICCYGSLQYRVFLCTSSFFPGTGDYEDEADLHEDQNGDCFCIWLEDMLKAGHICAGRGYYKTLPEAICEAENNAGFVKWLD